MKKLLLSLICAVSALGSQAAELPSNHVDLTAVILDFLSRTELCLNSCQDAQSVNAAIPTLQQLKLECDAIAEKQQNLPEPTVQDYMAVQNQMETFNTIWKAIREHLERLEKQRLITKEMRDILLIAEDSGN